MIAIGLVIALLVAVGGVVAALTLGGGSKKTTPPAGNVACGGTTPSDAATVSRFNNKYSKPPAMSIDTKKKYLWTLDTSCGAIQIELDPGVAPNTVNSIVFLTNQGLFNGSTFHRIVPGFVIQGGDPAGTGTGGPGYTVVDTPPANAQYPVGTVAMAKTSRDPSGTAGSQFFIVTAATAQQALAPGGTGQYAIAGKVVQGMDVVSKISAVPVANQTTGAPAQKIYIVKATVSAE